MIQAITALIQQQDPEKGLTESGGFDVMPSFLMMIGVLAVVVGIIFALAWLLKRFAGSALTGGGNDLLKIESTLSLGEKRLLVVVRAANKYLLLGLTGDSVTNLTELDEEAVKSSLDAKSSGEAGSFGSILSRFTNKNREEKP